MRRRYRDLAGELTAALRLKTSRYRLDPAAYATAIEVGYPPPRHRYLTASYVAWLRLPVQPLRVHRGAGLIAEQDGQALPLPQAGFLFDGVILDGWRYLKADDGLSYDAMGPA